jgi:DNA-binding NtrC family response regulator
VKEKKYFLIIEDDSTMRKAFSLLLKGKGRRVVEAKSGYEAEKLLKSRTFNLVITDLFLGDDISGLDIYQKHHMRMPVLIVTGFGESVLAEEARRVAGRYYLEKPFSMENFSALVTEMTNMIQRKGGKNEK